MLIFSIVVILLIIVLNIAAFIYMKKKELSYNIKRDVLPISGLIFICYIKKRSNKMLINEKLKKLNILKTSDYDLNSYICKLLSISIIIVLMVCLIGIILLTQDDNNNIVNSYYIEKPQYGASDKNVKISAKYNDECVNMNINVQPQELNEKQINKLISDVKKYIKKNIYYKDIGECNVSGRVNLVECYPDDNNISVFWNLDNKGLIDNDGYVSNKSDSVESVTITAVINYIDKIYEYDIKLSINPDEKADIKDRINECISEQTNSNNRYIHLPETIDNVKIGYEDEASKSKEWIMVFLLGCISVVCVIIMKNKEIDRKLEMRNEELLMDYSEVIHKFAIMLSAGFTIRRAWEKICRDYENTNKMRYVYEEMIYSLNEMNSNISEENAVIEFGKRIGIPVYKKLCTLFVQSIRRGNEMLINSMELEAVELMNNRKALIKQKAARMSNYLIFPMIVLLIIALALMMIPAIMVI